RQPDFITKSVIDKAIEEVEKKKNLAALSKIRFESFHEGLSAQIMHIGSFSEEGPTVAKLHAFIEEKGYQFDGSNPSEKHHEIYISDMRRTKPEKLKTIIRQPVK
ncbi:MAG TPA: GyrI-like domain-containing protein, partial [Methanobacterium sp.]|nr:GyrI-like domain-containing protein [Methanobacterium sp.]